MMGFGQLPRRITPLQKNYFCNDSILLDCSGRTQVEEQHEIRCSGREPSEPPRPIFMHYSFRYTYMCHIRPIWEILVRPKAYKYFELDDIWVNLPLKRIYDQRKTSDS
jgi:hypothetical protein